MRSRSRASPKSTSLSSTCVRTAAVCLRAKPVDELAKWSDDGLGSGPTTGGGMLPLSPKKAFTTGHFNRVPLIEGTTRDEHRLFTAAIEVATGRRTTDASYRDEIHTLFEPTDAALILARYPSDHFHSAGEALWCRAQSGRQILPRNTSAPSGPQSATDRVMLTTHRATAADSSVSLLGR
jgi:carboxylesterase type B